MEGGLPAILGGATCAVALAAPGGPAALRGPLALLTSFLLCTLFRHLPQTRGPLAQAEAARLRERPCSRKHCSRVAEDGRKLCSECGAKLLAKERAMVQSVRGSFPDEPWVHNSSVPGAVEIAIGLGVERPLTWLIRPTCAAASTADAAACCSSSAMNFITRTARWQRRSCARS